MFIGNKREYSRFCLLLLMMVFSTSASFSATNTARVEKGVLDLRYLSSGTTFSMPMNGEWEFYYERFLNPKDKNEVRIPDCYSTVPSYWSKNKNSGQKFKGKGYGTYRCVVLLPKDYENVLGFDCPVFDTSYEMYINGTLFSRNGRTGKNKYESTPKSFPTFIKYYVKSDTLDIIIKASNYELAQGGFWMSMRIGTYFKIKAEFFTQRFVSIIATGLLFSFFILFLVFYILNPHEKKILAFSIVTLTFAIEPLVTAPYLITLISPLNWNLLVNIGYINISLMIFSGAWLVHYLYPTRFSKYSAVASAVFFATMVLLIILTPPQIFTLSSTVIIISGVIIIGYGLLMSLKGVLNRQWHDLAFLIAFVLMIFGAYADIKLASGMGKERQIYLMSFTMLLCTFIQSILFIREWVKSSMEKVRLNSQLEDLTKHLEERVFHRTRELNRKTAEIENQHLMIVEQNAKLSDTIHIKNKIFSVISHDLRGPIVNIQYALNLLKEEEYRGQFESLTNSCIQYSQMVISLLENMLVWGRGQEDMIRYSPAEYDLADTVLTNLSIYKESADRKNISLNFTQKGKSRGWFDKDLVDIIIRNLISNAIKFTNRGGRVSIILNDRKNPDEELVLKIYDNGVGMSPKQLKEIFSSEDVQSTFGTESEKGTGLGLKLVYELITLSHGTILAESTPGIGTCFTIVLPGKNENKNEIPSDMLEFKT